MLELFMATGKPSASSAAAPIVLIAAHPDDEILGLGGQLADIPRLSLIHVTDGAPRNTADARRAGFADRDAYAKARALELDRALRAAGVGDVRRRGLDVVDQEAVEHLPQLIAALEESLREAAAVITHPYEGGHPDHDACALIVQCACERLQRAGEAPLRLEFTSYHAREGETARGVFCSSPGCLETVMLLDAARLARKRAALAEFATQRQIIAAFPADPERLRRAPWYDFSRPPPPGEVLYDRFGWKITGELWREKARRALAGRQ
jgi:LmbE family N-acetylglucosaminyl deacetylase